jgi:hypothetical protein
MNKITLTLEQINEIRNSISFIEGLVMGQKEFTGEEPFFSSTEKIFDILKYAEIQHNEEPK